MDIIDLINEAPQVNLTVSASDLRDFANLLIEQTKEELEHGIISGRTEKYLTTEETMKTLSVCKTTLWRWKKRKYLRPVRVGGNERYRLSDINKILEGDDDE